MSSKLHYPEHTLRNRRHRPGEAGRLPLRVGLCQKPQDAPVPVDEAQDPHAGPGPPPGPVMVALTPVLGGRPGSNDTLPRNHKFMNPRSFARSGQAQSLADVSEDIFLCQAIERSTETPAVRPQNPGL